MMAGFLFGVQNFLISFVVVRNQDSSDDKPGFEQSLPMFVGTLLSALIYHIFRAIKLYKSKGVIWSQ
jgi:hypothetical protein